MWPAEQMIHLGHYHRRRKDDGPVEVAPGLWYGARITSLQAERLLPREVAVLDVAPEYAAGWGRKQPGYMALHLLEGGAPIALDLFVCELFIDLHRDDSGVFIHGALGNSRAALVAATWLLRHYPRLTVEQVQAQLSTQRQSVCFSADQLLVLQQVRMLQQDSRMSRH